MLGRRGSGACNMGHFPILCCIVSHFVALELLGIWFRSLVLLKTKAGLGLNGNLAVGSRWVAADPWRPARLADIFGFQRTGRKLTRYKRSMEGIGIRLVDCGLSFCFHGGRRKLGCVIGGWLPAWAGYHGVPARQADLDWEAKGSICRDSLVSSVDS